jgi:DNA polymerase III alpha subunit (gram-positive type)
MTFEKKCLIEASDVVAVHFECNNCHASVVVPINAGVSNYAGDIDKRSCEFCHTPWEIASQSTEHRTIFGFSQSLEKLASIMEGRGLKLRMEIKCPE